MTALQKEDHVIIVSDGFSIAGFVLGWAWLIAKRLWIRGLIFLIIQVPLFFVLVAVFGSAKPDVNNLNEIIFLLPWLLMIVLNIYIGINVNRWIISRLIKCGYRKAGNN